MCGKILKNGNLPSIRNLISGNKVSLEKIITNFGPNKSFSMNCINQIEIDIKYDIYIKRQLNDIKQFELEQQTLIPKEVNFKKIKDGFQVFHSIYVNNTL